MIVRITHLNNGHVDTLQGTPDEVCRQATAMFPWVKHHPTDKHHNSNDLRHVLERIDGAQNLSVEVEV